MTRDNPIEQDVLALIRDSIRSIWTLELLVLLRRDRRRAWSETELVRELRGSPVAVRESLAALNGAGLIGPSRLPDVRYLPSTPLLDDAVARLLRAYERTPAAVMKAIADAPDDRIRTFADAFRFKR